MINIYKFVERRNVGPYLLFAGVLFAAWFFQSVTFIGFEGMLDDSGYVQAAAEWLNAFPHIGESHWAIRHPVVLSLALSLALFDNGLHAVAIPSLFCYFGMVGITFWATRSTSGLTAAVFCALSVAMVPIFGITADTLIVLPYELILIIGSFYLLWFSYREGKEKLYPVLAGVLCGVAFLARETTAAYIVGLGILFLLGWGPARKNYFYMAFGFLVVASLDTIYFGMMTGDWMYRWRISTNHSFITEATGFNYYIDPKTLSISAFLSKPEAPAGFVEAMGGRTRKAPYLEYALVDAGRILSPYLMLFVHYYFGLTYWLGFAGCLFISKFRNIFSTHKYHRLLPFSLIILGVTWFVFGTYVLGLRPMPRYWGLTTYAAAILGGFLFAWLWSMGRRVLVCIVLGSVFVSHLFLVEMNDSSVAYAPWLSNFVKQEQRVVHLSRQDWKKTKAYFSVIGQVGGLVKPLPDPAAERIMVFDNRRLPGPIMEEPDSWCKTFERKSRSTWTGQLLDALGVVELVPKKFRDPLMVPEANVSIYERKRC